MSEPFYITAKGKDYLVTPVLGVNQCSGENRIGFKIQIDGKTRALRAEIHPDENTAKGFFEELILESIKNEIERSLESL